MLGMQGVIKTFYLAYIKEEEKKKNFLLMLWKEENETFFFVTLVSVIKNDTKRDWNSQGLYNLWMSPCNEKLLVFSL